MRAVAKMPLAKLPVARESAVVIAVLVVGLAVAGLVSDYQALQYTQYLIYGLLALSFAYVWGHGGQFSFGQAALFGIGGYAYSIAAINFVGSTGETFSAVLVAIACSAVVAAILGYFMFYGEVADVYVAIITLATSLVISTVLSSTASPKYHVGDALLGGYNGMTGVPPITFKAPGGLPTPLTVSQTLQLLVVLAVLVTWLLHVLRRRPFGRIVSALRENELRTQLLGYDVRRYKLGVFVIGGAVAGLAGALFAAWGLFINPVVFGLGQATLVAIWVLVGGRTSLIGAFVGVFLIERLTSTLGGTGSSTTPIVLGAVLIAVVLVLPAGLVPSVASWVRSLRARRRRGVAPADGEAIVAQPRGELPPLPVLSATGSDTKPQSARLEASDLVKRFGGVTALDGVSLEFGEVGVHCLLGSNGAGKSTFFNLLVGRYRATEGRIMFGGTDVTKWRADQRARRGMGIKLQVASIYTEMSVFDNVWLASYASCRDKGAATSHAAAIIEWLGLSARSEELAGVLSHGEKQWLEIGMVVAAEPRVILLDEPTAGMTREETARTAALITSLAERVSVIVVEHDMEFIRQLDAPITMFHQGRVFTSGTLDDLRADERVLEIYLGRSVDVEA